MQRLVVGYDRDLARVCLHRNLKQIIRPGLGSSQISAEELIYFTERLLETVVFGYQNTFGNPWVHTDDSVELVKVPVRKMTRSHFQRCEMIANNLLIYEGVIARSGAATLVDRVHADMLKRKLSICSLFFEKSSKGQFRSADEAQVLCRMSKHVFDWVRYLSYFQGNDYLDLLMSDSSSGRIVTID